MHVASYLSPLHIDNKLNERLDKLGKFPCMYIITAAQELVRTHSDNTKGSDIRNTWLAEFQTMLEEVLVNPDFENDVGSTGAYVRMGRVACWQAIHIYCFCLVSS